ncbi:MAG: hypothetical protein ABFQ82_02340 [Thermodesulfobacteriota bacterium]
MERKLATEKELLFFLNAEQKKAGFGEGLYFESLVRLRVDDRNGCNWASANLKGCDPPATARLGRKRSSPGPGTGST